MKTSHLLLNILLISPFFSLGFASTLLNKPDRRWPWTGPTSASKRCPQMQLSNRWVMVNRSPLPSQQDCTKNQFGLWLLYLILDRPKVAPSHSPFCLYATGPWFLTTSHQTCFRYTCCSWGITLHPDLNLKTCILLLHKSLKHIRVLIQFIYMLYVVCTQLFYNKNVLKFATMARLDPSSPFQLFILKGTSPLADHHHAFLLTQLTLQIYCSLRIDFLIIQNSNCCIMSDSHNGGKKAAKDCCVHWCFSL